MVFDSYTFIAFLFAVAGLQRVIPTWRGQKTMLLAASYLFYAAWNPPFVFLLMFSTVVDWFVARGLAKLEPLPKRRRLLLLVSLTANLGLLGFFKYSGLLVETFVQVAALWGLTLKLAKPDVILPVGISFYTFQTLSYTIDVYRRKLVPRRSFLDYALYVTFFPQLVAGPIVRPDQFLPQCNTPRRATAAQVGWGLTLVLIGLFGKVVLADSLLAPVATAVYGAAEAPDTVSAWVGTLAFTGQIFFDFAGYSTCAIGAAMVLGFSLPTNFRYPYAAIGFSDFWRRWHISLSTWLRDYLYIPLGGSRRGRLRADANLMITMLLGGLWHGARWTFVAWGALHGTYLVVEKLVVTRFGGREWTRLPPVRFALALLTFALVCVTWVFFRATSFRQASAVVAAMVTIEPAQAKRLVDDAQLVVTLPLVLTLLVAHWAMRDTTLEQVAERAPGWLRAVIIAFLIVGLATASAEDRAFIYFQF